MQRREQRTGLHLERPIGHLLDPPGHLEAVALPGRERAKDQHFERAGEDRMRGYGHGVSYS